MRSCSDTAVVSNSHQITAACLPTLEHQVDRSPWESTLNVDAHLTAFALAFTSRLLARYANSAKQIVNRAVVNEDPKAAMIRGLRDELEMLLSKVGQGTVGAVGDDDEYRRLQDQLIETERLIHVTAASWEDRLKESQVVMDVSGSALSPLD